MNTRLVITVLLVCSLASPVAAGPSEDASAAYIDGHYEEALRLWLPKARHGFASAQYGCDVR